MKDLPFGRTLIIIINNNIIIIIIIIIAILNSILRYTNITKEVKLQL